MPCSCSWFFSCFVLPQRWLQSKGEGCKVLKFSQVSNVDDLLMVNLPWRICNQSIGQLTTHYLQCAHYNEHTWT
jgi:hypothetical protein